ENLVPLADDHPFDVVADGPGDGLHGKRLHPNRGLLLDADTTIFHHSCTEYSDTARRNAARALTPGHAVHSRQYEQMREEATMAEPDAGTMTEQNGDATRPTLLLIDGYGLIFRAYHAMPAGLATSKG